MVQRILWTAMLAATLATAAAVAPAHAARTAADSQVTVPAAERGGPIGAVTLGRLAPAGASVCSNGSSGEGYAWLSNFVDPTKPSYTTPYAGVITSFSNQSNGVAGRLQALFFVPNGDGTHYLLAHSSSVVSVVAGRVNTFPLRIPVNKGEILALRTIDPNLECVGAGMPIDQILANSFSEGQQTLDFSGTPLSLTGTFVDVSAVLEPDVDDDGYGDVSQDGCPGLAAVHDPCPAPVVTVTKKPTKRTHAHRVKVKFRADVVGSTFACSIDGRAFKSCHSPFKGRFLPGTHTVRVMATSPVGVAGQPVTVQFKVVKARR